MGTFGIIFAIIWFFIKFVFFVIGLAIAIPILFVLSLIVCIVTGVILSSVYEMLSENTNLVDKFEGKVEAWIEPIDKWFDKYRKDDDKNY